MNKKKPELLILAAGVGSRYGGLKQLDGVGPNGETIMDYSIFDAIRNGFGKVVFVIKEEHLDLFESRVVPKFNSRIDIGYAFQSIDVLPDGVDVPRTRTKPWGTGHAVLCGKREISGPFAVINADDFYGNGAFRIMADTLCGLDSRSEEFFLLGYRLVNTLSRHGSVSRGLCEAHNGYLATIKELTKVSVSDGRIANLGETGDGRLDPEAVVSMNFWGFTPRVFDFFEKGFTAFLDQNSDSPNAEYFITTPIDDAVKTGQACVKLLTTDEKWLGITYQDDKDAVTEGIRERIQNGLYPADLAAEMS